LKNQAILRRHCTVKNDFLLLFIPQKLAYGFANNTRFSMFERRIYSRAGSGNPFMGKTAPCMGRFSDFINIQNFIRIARPPITNALQPQCPARVLPIFHNCFPDLKK